MADCRRSKKPIILTVDQYFAILQLLIEPYRTMVVVAQCLGLRVSEILALRWPDINFAELTMRVTQCLSCSKWSLHSGWYAQ